MVSEKIRNKILLARLIEKEKLGKISRDELIELDELLKDISNRRVYDDLDYIDLDCQDTDEAELAYQKFEKEYLSQRNGRRIIKLSKPWSIAASLAMLVAASVLFFNVGKHIYDNQQVLLAQEKIEPGKRAAELKLANGEKILLGENDSLSHKSNKANITINKKEVAYQQSAGSSINTLEIGRGQEFNLILSDGTKVWLNSETSLTYPTKFNDSIREVELKGEAYFEVSKGRPFFVNTGNVKVQVLGTSFNVKSYPEDEYVHTTLIEGKVKVFNEFGEVNLLPNQQAYFNEASQTWLKKEVIAQIFASWRNRKFKFNNERLEDVFTTLSRWYDIEVFYRDQDVKEEMISFCIDKGLSFNEVIEHLNYTEIFEYELNDGLITIKARE